MKKIKAKIADSEKNPGFNDSLYSVTSAANSIPKAELIARTMQYCAKALGGNYNDFIKGKLNNTDTGVQIQQMEEELATLFTLNAAYMSDGEVLNKITSYLRLANRQHSPSHQLALWGLRQAAVDIHNDGSGRLPQSQGMDIISGSSEIVDVDAAVAALKQLKYEPPKPPNLNTPDDIMEGTSKEWRNRVRHQVKIDSGEITVEDSSREARSTGDTVLRKKETNLSEQIIDKVAELYGVEPDLLKTYGREAAEARSVAMYLVARATKFGANQVGKLFGGFSDNTVYLAINKMEKGELSEKTKSVIAQTTEALQLKVRSKRGSGNVKSTQSEEENPDADVLRDKYRNCYEQLQAVCAGTTILKRFFPSSGLALDPDVFRAKYDGVALAAREAGRGEEILPILERFSRLHTHFNNAFEREQGQNRLA